METYLNKLQSVISQDNLSAADLYLRENVSGIDSFIIHVPATPYHEEIDNILFARIKTTGKIKFISFRKKYNFKFKQLNIQTTDVKSNSDYIRIDLDLFFSQETLSNPEVIKLLNWIFIDTMSFPTFGCCSRYKECSNARKCIHPDQMYATACSYRKHLENGRIFYGESKNYPKPEKILFRVAAFDVETPNKKNDSICSIGIVYADEEGVVNEFYSLVNPEEEFDKVNIAIHGITPQMVQDAPTFSGVWEEIKDIFSNNLLVGHNIKFDLSCIKKLLKKNGIEAQNPYYIDTLEIAKQIVPDLESYKLPSLCKYYHINIANHHNALDDSRATFYLLKKMRSQVDLNSFTIQYDYSDVEKKARNRQFEYSDTTKYLQELQGIVFGIMSDNVLNDDEIEALKYWMDTHQALKGNYPFDRIYTCLKNVLEDGIITEDERTELANVCQSILNPMESESPCVLDSDIEGKTICLTGDFSSMSRKEMELFLVNQGAIIKNGVSKKLDYLVVGDLGSDQWTQCNYGSKIKRAMECNEKGADITIVRECDFIKIFEI